MATKNNPGEFDCYANAEDDEPMFILLARDPLAPVLVRLWAYGRIWQEGSTDKSHEALIVATAMEAWQRKKERGGRSDMNPITAKYNGTKCAEYDILDGVKIEHGKLLRVRWPNGDVEEVTVTLHSERRYTRSMGHDEPYSRITAVLVVARNGTVVDIPLYGLEAERVT